MCLLTYISSLSVAWTHMCDIMCDSQGLNSRVRYHAWQLELLCHSTDHCLSISCKRNLVMILSVSVHPGSIGCGLWQVFCSFFPSFSPNSPWNQVYLETVVYVLFGMSKSLKRSSLSLASLFLELSLAQMSSPMVFSSMMWDHTQYLWHTKTSLTCG